MTHHALEYISLAGGFYGAWSNRAAHGVWRHSKDVIGFAIIWKWPGSPVASLMQSMLHF